MNDELEWYQSYQTDSGDIVMFTGNQEMLRLCDNGDIKVKGKLITNDSEVVEGMKELLRLTKINRK